MTKILEERKQERTSKAQIIWLGLLWQKLLKKIGGHVKRFGLIYGFLGGMVSTLLILAAVIWYGVLAYPLPWKVIDPTDPRFDPMKFEFTDYDNSRDFGAALRVMFPVGTEKEIVDKALGDAGARIVQNYIPNKREYKGPKNLYYYQYGNIRSYLLDYVFVDLPQGEFSWKAAIYYDDNNKIQKIVIISP